MAHDSLSHESSKIIQFPVERCRQRTADYHLEGVTAGIEQLKTGRDALQRARIAARRNNVVTLPVHVTREASLQQAASEFQLAMSEIAAGIQKLQEMKGA